MTEQPEILQFGECVAGDFPNFLGSVNRGIARCGGARPWWRGQLDATWDLLPSLYRSGLASKEANLTGRFRLMAKVRTGDVPASNDPLGWLFLMQHYGLPTRLLDWSQSPLVALFFAVQPPDDTDAAVWALHPTRMNALEAGVHALFMPRSQAIAQLGWQAFRLTVKERDERVVAVLTEEADLRQMLQQAVFTLHGSQGPLNQRRGSEDYLMKIRIPASAKPMIRKDLGNLGINRASLFPDLENLALELASLKYGETSALNEIANEAPIASDIEGTGE